MYTTFSWYSAAQCSRFTVRPHSVGIRGPSRCVFVCTAVWASGGRGGANLNQWQRSAVIKTQITSKNVMVRLSLRRQSSVQQLDSEHLTETLVLVSLVSPEIRANRWKILHFNGLKGNCLRQWEATNASCPTLKCLNLDMIWDERNFLCKPSEL